MLKPRRDEALVMAKPGRSYPADRAEGECYRQDELEEVRAILRHGMYERIDPWKSRLAHNAIELSSLVEEAAVMAAVDLLTLSTRDPASKGSWRYVVESYTSFRAVLAYRLAHAVATAPCLGQLEALIVARSLSERAKVETGVEIHPSAEIGPRFVVDHGMGTVIGEDVVIGTDCYLLQGVAIGALGIANNTTGRRHPWLGDRVEVGCFARLLGPISIGDDVVVGSHTLVRNNVPASSQVSVLHQYQIVSGPRPVIVYGIEALGKFRFRLHGRDLNRPGLQVDVLGPSQIPLKADNMAILQRNAKYMTVKIFPRACDSRAITHIRLHDSGSAVTLSLPFTRSPQKPTN
ncbi:MAG: serine O-acetyltransferase [Pseudonocardiaceae bacterium]